MTTRRSRTILFRKMLLRILLPKGGSLQPCRETSYTRTSSQSEEGHDLVSRLG